MIRINESAKDAIILNKDSKSIVASQIALNAEGEHDAIEGYEKLIPWLEKYDDQESIGHIREIISDEKNHLELLTNILKKYDGIEPAKD
jgi:rubrerythrin